MSEQPLGKYLLSHPWAMALAIAVFGSFPLLVHAPSWVGLSAYVACYVLLALATLRLGPRAGLLYWLLAASPVFLTYWRTGQTMLLLNQALFGSWWVWFLASVLCLTRSWRWLLLTGTLLGMVFLLTLGQYWLTVMQPGLVDMFKHMLTTMNADRGLGLSAKQIDQAVTAIVMHMPGVWVFLANLVAAFAVFLARLWQSRLYIPGAARTELCAIRMDKLSCLLTVLLFALVFSGNVMAQNLMVIAAFPWVVSGLSVLHAVSIRFGRYANFFLVAFYVMIVFLAHVVVLCLLVTGLLDALIDMRRVWGVKTVEHGQLS